MRPTLLALSLLLSQSPAQKPTVVIDLDSTPIVFPSPAYPNPLQADRGIDSQKWMRMGGWIYFLAFHSHHGGELFRTDGDKVELIKDIVPGQGGSNPGYFTTVGSRLYFSAATTTAGNELWVTDGTAAGTRQVADILPGTGHSNPNRISRLGNQVVFRAYTPATGEELFISDGTATGTRLLKDIRPGAVGSNLLHPVTSANGRLVYFQANDGVHGIELWVTDGTPQGTMLLKDIWPGITGSNAAYPRALTGDRVVFEADDGKKRLELWVSDGTSKGTYLLKDSSPSTLIGARTRFGANLGGSVFFYGVAQATGSEPWITDGTAAGTSLLADTAPGSTSGGIGSTDVDGAKVYWTSGNAYREAIWTSDGTKNGTRQFSPTSSTIRDIRNLEATGGKVYFSARDLQPNVGNEIGVCDGTVAGTRLLKDIWPDNRDSNPKFLGEVKPGVVAFSANDGSMDDMWITKGTPKTTYALEVNPPPSTPVTRDDMVWDMVALHGKLVFSGKSGETVSLGGVGQELWKTDGTAKGTTLVKDVNPNISGLYNLRSEITNLTRLGNRVLFNATRGNRQYELWVSDGTTAGTIPLLLRPRGWVEPYNRYCRIGKKVYFSATSPSGREPWVTDGTVLGTRQFMELVPGINGGGGDYFTRLGRSQSILFAASDGHISPGKGVELWITDGTPANTRLVKDIVPGSASSKLSGLTALGDLVYFTAWTPEAGSELWVSDGTTAGTKIVVDLVPGKGSSIPLDLVAQNGKLFFRATTPKTGTEIFVSDGTAAGTRLFAELSPGYTDSYPSGLTRVGSRRIYFNARMQSPGVDTGHEPMWIDTTTAKVHVIDMDPRPGKGALIVNAGSASGLVKIVRGLLYFSANLSKPTDSQLFWMSNGALANRVGDESGSTVL
jgi:ELWxxDGT repeat protein